MQDEIKRIEKAYQERDESGISSSFSYDNPAFLFHMQERERVILNSLKNSGIFLSNKDILEVGCGTGHILHRFVEFGARKASGIELMPNRVALANKNYPSLDIRQGNAASLPYPDNSFDLVTQFMCISSVHDADTREKIAREMWRVLKPGGAFLSYDLRPIVPVYGTFRAILGKIRRLFYTPVASSTPTLIKPLSLNEIRQWNLPGKIIVKKISLSFHWAVVARYSRFLAEMLAHAPWLLSSLLVIIKKPVE